jgi:hypothetical protein
LKVIALNVVEEAFKVVDGLQERWNEGGKNGEAKAPFDKKGQQPLGDTKFDLGDQKHNFDPMTLDDAMKELYACSKCIKLATTILLMTCAQYIKLAINLHMNFLHFYIIICFMNQIV